VGRPGGLGAGMGGTEGLELLIPQAWSSPPPPPRVPGAGRLFPSQPGVSSPGWTRLWSGRSPWQSQPWAGKSLAPGHLKPAHSLPGERPHTPPTPPCPQHSQTLPLVEAPLGSARPIPSCQEGKEQPSGTSLG
jgi:hypothetical protein